ncbi:unnamed protein product [Linum trigynum]|uniref:Uncharacterized protein n=1 Tax=Linum trigynum TaxID=586398 RepID=A0AAV2FD80_9ROSI
MTLTRVYDEEANLFAMQLASASVLPMMLKSALEMDLLEIIVKAGPGACLSPAEICPPPHQEPRSSPHDRQHQPHPRFLLRTHLLTPYPPPRNRSVSLQRCPCLQVFFDGETKYPPPVAKSFRAMLI